VRLGDPTNLVIRKLIKLNKANAFSTAAEARRFPVPAAPCTEVASVMTNLPKDLAHAALLGSNTTSHATEVLCVVRLELRRAGAEARRGCTSARHEWNAVSVSLGYDILFI
jgi:hypothetical protein